MSGSGIALCLGSSFRGYYAHCGFLAAFSSCVAQPSKIAGTSAGALAALFYAVGYRGDDLIKFITAPGLTRSFFDWGFPLRIPGVVAHLYGTGIFTGDGAVGYLRDRLGSKTVRLEQLHDPQLGIAVTDLIGGKSRLVTHGDAIEYAVASCMVPGLFRARSVDGGLLWDGGLANDLPFQHFIDDPDIDTIVLHNIKHAAHAGIQSRTWNMTRALAASHEIISDELTARRKELANLKGKRIVEFVTETPHPGLTHKHQHTLLAAGEQTGEQALRELS